MDQTDLKIISILQNNGRISMKDVYKRQAAPSIGPAIVPIAIVACSKPMAKPRSSLGVVVAISMVAAGMNPESPPAIALIYRICTWLVAKPTRAYDIVRTVPARINIGRLPYPVSYTHLRSSSLTNLPAMVFIFLSAFLAFALFLG